MGWTGDKRNLPHYVYVADFGDSVKIGMSADVAVRLKTITETLKKCVKSSRVWSVRFETINEAAFVENNAIRNMEKLGLREYGEYMARGCFDDCVNQVSLLQQKVATGEVRRLFKTVYMIRKRCYKRKFASSELIKTLNDRDLERFFRECHGNVTTLPMLSKEQLKLLVRLSITNLECRA